VRCVQRLVDAARTAGIHCIWAAGSGWASVTVTAALIATAFDAVLLQRRHTYFTGGFLSIDHVKTVGEAIVFALTSFVADAAVVGGLAALALWACSYTRFRRGAKSIVALVIGLAPILITDFVSYELLQHLGDVDLSLALSVARRSISEIFAFASWHLMGPASVVVGVGVVVGGAVWAIHRYLPRDVRRAPLLAPPRQRIALLAALVGTGLCVTTVARVSSEVLDLGLKQKPSGYILSYVVGVLSDIDGDGYGLFSRARDPDLFDGRVFPYAVEIPGNGIDENGTGGDLPPDKAREAEHVLAAEQARFAGRWTFTPDLVLIFLESVRADVLGLVKDGTAVTPVLNRLAAHGAASQYAFSHNGFTIESRYHLFTGRLPWVRNGTTLIDDFKANGYQVAYFSGQDESFGGSDWDVGFNRADIAYDARADVKRRYSTFTSPGSLSVPFSVVQERVNAFLEGRTSTQPLLLYLNLADTHFPYHHSGIQPLITRAVLPRRQMSAGRTEELRAMYLNTVANVDRAIGEIIEKTRRSLGKEPAVLVTSDHGESLFDHGFLGHGWALNDVQTRIPLIVANLPITIEEPFGQADLRGAIHAALSDPPPVTRSPVVREKASGTILQYLGTFESPAQIALTERAGRTVYDFWSRKFSANNHEWRHPADLRRPEVGAFLELVHLWEGLVRAGTRTNSRSPG
jgi:Sulfatase